MWVYALFQLSDVLYVIHYCAVWADSGHKGCETGSQVPLWFLGGVYICVTAVRQSKAVLRCVVSVK